MSNLLTKFLNTVPLWRNYALILREFKHFRWVVVQGMMFTFLAAALEGVGVGCILSFLHGITDPNTTPIQTNFEWFNIWVLKTQATPTERLFRISGLILLVTWVRSMCTYCSQMQSGMAQIHLIDRLRERLFEQLQALSLGYFTKVRSGELMNTITSEIYQVAQGCQVFTTLVITSTTMAVYLIALFILSWQLAVLSVLLFYLLAAGITFLLRQARELSFERSKTAGKHSSITIEFIYGIRTIHAFAAQKYERQRFDRVNSEISRVAKKAVRLGALIDPVAEGVATTILIAMLILAFTVLIPTNQMQPATLLTFLFVLFRLMPTVRQVNVTRAQLRNFQGSFENVKQLLCTDDKPYLPNGKRSFCGFQRAIEFVSVDFGYIPEQNVLKNITLTIPRGQVTAIVGASGAGKSTLVDLIPRFYDPTNGRILVDGVDLRDFEIHSLRQRLAVVSQDTFIFNSSVSENIAYALPEANPDAVQEAARLANALEFIQELPEGFETQLGDRGVRLSGGQRQRIAIARALLRDPEILILDEATSALDSVSERFIQESLETLSVGRTVIAIAHRLSTIARADQVIVLEQGQIIERGTYRELLKQRGRLWKYHQMQRQVGYHKQSNIKTS